MNDFEDEPTQFGIPEENLDSQENQESQEDQNNQDNQDSQAIEVTVNNDEPQEVLPTFDNQHDGQIKSGFGNDKHKTGNLKENREFTDLAKNHLRTLRRERRDLLEKIDQLEDQLIRTYQQQDNNRKDNSDEDDYGIDWDLREKIRKANSKLMKINRGINALVDAICFA